MNYIGSKRILAQFIKNTIKFIAVEIKQGLMRMEEIKKIMGKYGKQSILSKSYRRFKANKDENRGYDSDKTKEYIHMLEKDV